MTERTTRSTRRRAAVTAAVGAAAALALAACAGTAGTPTLPSDPPGPGPSTSASSGVAPTVDPAVSTRTHTPTRPVDAAGPGDVTGTSGAGTSGAVSDTVTGAVSSQVPGDLPDVVTPSSVTTFDARTTAWFVTLCTSLADAVSLNVPSYPYVTDGGTEQSVDQIRSDALADYAALQAGFAAGAEALADMPPPTFTGGAQTATDVVASLRAMADVASDAPAALTAAHTRADLEAAMEDLQDRMRDAEDLVPSDSPLVSDEVTAGIQQIPECRPMFEN